MSKIKHPFGIVSGGGRKPNGTPPVLSTVKEAPKEKRNGLTASPFMQKVIDAYQNAALLQKQKLEVIWDNRTQNPIFVTAINDDHLLEIILSDYPSIISLDSDAQHSSVYIFDDTSKPFEDYITEEQIRDIRDWHDLAYLSLDQAEQSQFNDPYGVLPELSSEVTQAIKQNPYSEKFQLIEKKFKEVKEITDRNKPQFCYILADEQGQLDHVVNEFSHSTAVIQQSLDSTGAFPNMKIIAAFNLHEDSFESQLRACGFDPTQDVTWEDLIAYPVDCVGDIPKLLAKDVDTTVVPFRRNP